MTGARAASPRSRLIRHAQASWGSADYDCLSALGVTQAQTLGSWLAAEPGMTYTHVVRGSLRRHAHTLELIEAAFGAAGRALPVVRVDPDWNEFDHESVLRAYAAAHAGDPNVAAARTGDNRALRAVLMAALQGW